MRRSPLVVFCIFLAQFVHTQIPVELFGGDKKASLDLMFFKFFKDKTGQNSRFLFFSRERAVVDYQQTTTTNLPQFGFTEAISYNNPVLRGFAPVLVGQVLNRGTFAKTGVQYAHVSTSTTIFGWTVAELQREPSVDVFLLIRYTPKLTEKLHLYTQLETGNAFPTSESKVFSFVQRLRLGLKIKDWQFGTAADFSQTGRNRFSTTENSGLFLRHEF